MIGLELMLACAPQVAPATLEQIVRVESAGNPLALNVNPKWVREADGNRRAVPFNAPLSIKTLQDAVTVSHMALEAGHSVDMGYMQVNSRHLRSLGYGVEDLFDPCKNLAAGAEILSRFYRTALSQYPNPQSALRAALSAYNTGDFQKGFSNGYVARYGLTPAKSTQTSSPYAAATAVWVRSSLSLSEDRVMPDSETRKTSSISIESSASWVMQVDPLISQSAQDSKVPGVQVEHSAEEAEAYGAFVETSLSEEDAWASNADLTEDSEGTAIVIQGKDVSKGGR